MFGSYVHPNIMIGAKYRVRSIKSNKYLFNGEALKLQSIGRGYGKRITFASDSIIENDNYFYSDTCGGFGLSIDVVRVGDSFTLTGCDHGEVLGELEVTHADRPQRQLPCPNTSHAYVNLTMSCCINFR